MAAKSLAGGGGIGGRPLFRLLAADCGLDPGAHPRLQMPREPEFVENSGFADVGRRPGLGLGPGAPCAAGPQREPEFPAVYLH